jgi:hypothetical protein
MTVRALLRRPSAFLPIAMSLVALTFVVWFVASHGGEPVRGEDEGAPARLFQLLLVAQLPIAAWFAIKWLPRAPRQAAVILVLQCCAGLAAIALVIVLEH